MENEFYCPVCETNDIAKVYQEIDGNLITISYLCAYGHVIDIKGNWLLSKELKLPNDCKIVKY